MLPAALVATNMRHFRLKESTVAAEASATQNPVKEKGTRESFHFALRYGAFNVTDKKYRRRLISEYHQKCTESPRYKRPIYLLRRRIAKSAARRKEYHQACRVHTGDHMMCASQTIYTQTYMYRVLL